jgi:hypothetical protein
MSIPSVHKLHNLNGGLLVKGGAYYMGKESHRDDRFSRMMFGDRRESMRGNHHREPDNNSSSLDIESIIENISKLRDSSQNLKPLFQMVYPFVQGFLNKK